MKDALFIQNRLSDLIATTRPQTPDATRIFNEKKELLLWAYNDGNLRTENELNIKLQNIEEELVAWKYAGDTGLLSKISQAKLQEIKQIM